LQLVFARPNIPRTADFF